MCLGREGGGGGKRWQNGSEPHPRPCVTCRGWDALFWLFVPTVCGQGRLIGCSIFNDVTHSGMVQQTEQAGNARGLERTGGRHADVSEGRGG